MKKFLQRFLKTTTAQTLIGALVSKAGFLIPVKRLRETRSWMAFVHPEPCYPVHIVILPKRAVSDWMALPVNEPDIYAEFVELTQSMICDFCLADAGYRLIVNGGKYQTFPLLHVHLVAGDAYSPSN